MRTAVVPAAEILGAEGLPLAAEFWTERKPGEPVSSWRTRTEIGRAQDAMDRHLDRAAQAAARITRLTELVPPEFRDHQEGQADDGR